MPKQINWSPKPELGERWDAFVSAREAEKGRKHLGNSLLTEAISAYLSAKTVPISEQNGHNPPADSVISATIPEFENLPEDVLEAAKDFIEILQKGEEWQKQGAMSQVQSWRKLKAVSDVIGAKIDPPKHRQATKRAASNE